MSNVVQSETNAEVVAKRFIDVVTFFMKRSSAPMMGLIEEFDLSFAQMKSMFVMAAQEEPLAIGRLAEITGQSLPSAGRAIDGLVRAGLVTRTEDPDDRRVKRVELTATGESEVEKIHRERLNKFQDALLQLDESDLAALASALEPLAAVVDAETCAAESPNTQKEAG